MTHKMTACAICFKCTCGGHWQDGSCTCSPEVHCDPLDDCCFSASTGKCVFCGRKSGECLPDQNAHHVTKEFTYGDTPMDINSPYPTESQF